MNKNEVSLRDPALNQKLPGYTITRSWDSGSETDQLFGVNGASEMISQNYWENAASVSDYLQRLDDTNVLDKCATDQVAFSKLLIKLHLIQTKGLLRDKEYGGQSINITPSENWQSEYRSPEFKVYMRISPELTRRIVDYMNIVDQKDFSDGKNFTLNLVQIERRTDTMVHTFTVDAYTPRPLLPFSSINRYVAEESTEELFTENSPVSTRRNTPIAFFLDEAIITGKLPENSEEKDIVRVAFPSAAYIPAYLELMRANLQNVLSAKEKKAQIHFLANAYQAGIRCQAFETVWNSEMMGMVNFFLSKKLQMNPIAHGSLDAYALLLSEESFEKYFENFVAHFNPAEESLGKDVQRPDGAQQEWRKFAQFKKLTFSACHDGSKSLSESLLPEVDKFRINKIDPVYVLSSEEEGEFRAHLQQVDQLIHTINSPDNSVIDRSIKSVCLQIHADLDYLDQPHREAAGVKISDQKEVEQTVNGMTFKVPDSSVEALSILDRLGQFALEPYTNSSYALAPNLTSHIFYQFIQRYPEYTEDLYDFEFRYLLRDLIGADSGEKHILIRSKGLRGNSIVISERQVVLLNQVQQKLTESGLLNDMAGTLGLQQGDEEAPWDVSTIALKLANKWGDEIRHMFDELSVNPSSALDDQKLKHIYKYYEFVLPEAIQKLEKFRQSLLLKLGEVEGN